MSVFQSVRSKSCNKKHHGLCKNTNKNCKCDCHIELKNEERDISILQKLNIKPLTFCRKCQYDFKVESKALHQFTKFLHTSTTLKHYMAHLRKYAAWANLDYDQLVSRDAMTIQTELENYLELLQKEQGHGKAYVKLAFAGITLFYEMNDRIINKTKLRKMINPNEEKNKLEAYTNEDILEILDAIDESKLRKHPKFKLTRLRLKTMVHFLASSGVRIQGMTRTRIKDLKQIENCYQVEVYPGSDYDYVTFLTPQASEVLNQWLEIRKQQCKNQVFENCLLFDLPHDSLYTTLSRLVRKANLDYESNGKRYPKPLNHAYRYRWNTIAKSNKDVNPTLVEKMLGHKTSIALDRHYLKPTPEALFAEYKKIIKELTL